MKGGDTRARIERAAMELFVDKGVRETTIKDIAERAGVSEGAMYRHHAGKDELVWHLFSLHFAALGEELARATAEAKGCVDAVGRMVRVFCALHDADPVLFGFLLLVQHGQLARVPADMPNPVQQVIEAVAKGMEGDEIPAGDPQLRAAMVMGIVLQAATFKLYGRISLPMGDLAPTLVTACKAVLLSR
ncbi:MAG: TetR/AcrR family transcriptional regulator [Solirubrobacterales bacterium]